MKYQGAFPTTDQPPCTGVLLTNLGTPDTPATKDVRRYLAEFLSDPRVVEVARPVWWLVLHGVILRTRPRRSAKSYAKIWTDQGSPLMLHTRHQATALEASLNENAPGAFRVEPAMRYGQPSIASALDRLRQANAQRLVILPLYPQYSATTTASTFDAMSSTLRGWRWIPAFNFINQYHDHPAYIEALANSVKRFQAEHGPAERLLISFHGIPEEYAAAGDPYPDQCQHTAELLARSLKLSPDQWGYSFQSRMGSKAWIQPYTDETLKQWGAAGVRKVQVICPGFPADCLETLEEIGEENRDYFIQAGGREYHYIPALNDAPEHIAMLARLVNEQLK